MKKYLIVILDIIAISMIVGSVLVYLQYLYMDNNNSCMNNPLVYGANRLEDLYGYEFVGTGFFIGTNIQSPIVSFNNKSFTIETAGSNSINLLDFNIST